MAGTADMGRLVATARPVGLLLLGLFLLFGIGSLGGCAGPESAQPPENKLDLSEVPEYDPEAPEYDTVYTEGLDEAPELQGGVEGLLERVDYPDEAVQNRIEGTVIVGFIVSPEGVPTHVEVIRPVHPLLAVEARDVVQASTFSPGRVDGTPVPVLMTIPVMFSRP